MINIIISLSYYVHCDWLICELLNPVKKLVNDKPEASNLQAFLVFSQHPKWVYYGGKLPKNAV